MQDDTFESPMKVQGASRTRDAIDRFMDIRGPKDEEPVRKRHPMDKEPMERMHRRLWGFYTRELSRQEANRFQMAKDQDCYDNEQWDAEDKATVESRGQMALVYNVVANSVDWIIGTEKRGRTDYKILPRRPDASKPAQRKTELFKYLEDVNRSPFHRSRAFEDAVKVGVGWLECGIQDQDDGEPLYDRYESWRNMLWDSAATELDLKDARYLFRTRWVDLDVAVAMFPDRAGFLKESASDAERGNAGVDLLHGDDPMDSQEEALELGLGDSVAGETSARERLRMVEAWFRRPMMVQRLSGGEFSGEVYDPEAPGHRESVERGEAKVTKKTVMRMTLAIMTANGLLFLDNSPYRHNEYPFTPIWCYRRGRDNMPYGIIRRMRDIQTDINKRAAKALHILSTNKTIMEEGAVANLDEYLEEVSRPDAVIVKKTGKFLELNAERELAPAHLELMSRSINMIQQISGVTDEAMGRTTNASAGVAIRARQDQAGMATAGLFDNLRLAVQVHGEKKLSIMEQSFTDEKAFRITNQRGTPQYVKVNDGLPENDIIRSKADFIISEEDWRASVRQQQVAELMDLLAKIVPVAPQMALVVMDLLIEGMDISNREEIVKRIRAMTGQQDPDQDEPSPEQVAKAQQQQAEAELQQRAITAKIGLDEAGAQLKAQQATKLQADIQLVLAQTAGGNVGAQKAALEAALLALANPAVAAVGDTILHESGFQSRTEQEEDSRAQGVMQGEEQQRQQAAQQQAQQEQQAMQQEEQARQQQAGAIKKAMDQMNPVEREAAEQQLAQQAQAEQQVAQQGGGQGIMP